MSDPAPPGTLDERLALGETRLQAFLAERPPPFYVQRQLRLDGIAPERRVAFLREVFPSVEDTAAFEMTALADAATCTQRDDIACLNRYFYIDVEGRLAACANDLRELLDEAKADPSRGEQAYRGAELLAYARVEQLHWQFITQPLPRLVLDPAVLAEAAVLVEQALPLARDKRDWLRWHRLSANKARLGFLAGDRSPELPRGFDMAMSLGQLCLDHGIAVDAAFPTRRDELLHMAAVVKYMQQSMTYVNLSAHVKSPARIKPPPGDVRLTIESGKLIGNLSLPLPVMHGASVDAKALEGSAFVDLLACEDRLLVWMTFRGKVVGRSFAYRELHRLDSLDLVVRPSLFEIELQSLAPASGQEPLPGEDKVAFMGPGSWGRTNLDSTAIPGKQWRMSFPLVELGIDPSGARTRREAHPDLFGLPWETMLGKVWQQLLAALPEPPSHLVVSPDGPLALLPLHLARLDDGAMLCERLRVSYAPGLAHFAPAPLREPGRPPTVAVILNSRNQLQGPIWELARMRQRLGEGGVRTLDAFAGDDAALQQALADRDVIHVATHGQTFTDSPETSGIELHRGRILPIRAIERFDLRPGCLVFLNACGSSKVMIRSRIQFSSIANAFLSAGAGTVIATFWEADDVSAALLSDRFYGHFLDEGRGRLESLALALEGLRGLDLDELSEATLGTLSLFLPAQRKQPFASASYWGQFALFGRW